MIARLRKRLNELETAYPLEYAVALILACDAVLFIALHLGANA